MSAPAEVLDTAIQPEVTPFFDQGSNTLSYVVKDPGSKACAVIDSVLNLDYASGTVSFGGADTIITYIESNKLDLQWILETHVHADHLSAARYIQQQVGGRIAIGGDIATVQETFGEVFCAGPGFARDGSQFDVLLGDDDQFDIGGLTARAMHTPGHTPACMTYVVGDALFVGDTLFMPDGGTARADFPGGDARILYRSIHRILAQPEHYRIFVCHDYLPNDRELEFETTVADQRAQNIHVHTGVSEDAFVSMREKRDATLGMPNLILPSLQVNMRAGQVPPAQEGKRLSLTLPLNVFGGPDLASLQAEE